MNKQQTVTLVETIIDSIQEKKGKNIISLNISHLQNTSCDYFVICDATSTTQVDAIANFVDFNVKEKLEDNPLHIEGKETSRWVLLDYGDVVVHVFLEEQRNLYKLEKLWADGKAKRFENLL